MRTVNIATDFTRHPAGRYTTDGDYSGERFRKEFLIPALSHKEKITIKLDGARGYGSSFLEEAFGGLIRDGHSAKEVFDYITLESINRSLIMEITQYIKDADKIATCR